MSGTDFAIVCIAGMLCITVGMTIDHAVDVHAQEAREAHKAEALHDAATLQELLHTPPMRGTVQETIQ